MKRDLLLEPLPPGKLPPWLLKKVLPGATADPRVLIGPGIGRDAAAIAIESGILVAKSDPITFASEGGEEHLVDINANDIACMGATPRWLLVTTLLPEGVTPADVLNGFAALREACRQRSVELVGGHSEVVAGLHRPILVGMMLGETTPDELIPVGNAQPGDVLLLTKSLAIEGTALLARERREELVLLLGEAVADSAMNLLRHPGISIVRDAELARATGGVTALHDPTEGGLATAVRELATVSGVGVSINGEDVPILDETRAIAELLGLDPLGMLASGALRIAARPAAVSAISRSLASAGIPATPIGVLTDRQDEFIVRRTDGEETLPEFAVDEVARLLASQRENGEGVQPCS